MLKKMSNDIRFIYWINNLTKLLIYLPQNEDNCFEYARAACLSASSKQKEKNKIESEFLER